MILKYDEEGPFEATAAAARRARAGEPGRIEQRNGIGFYVDASLGGHPILPTAARMRADSRFTGRGITLAFVDSGFFPHPDLVYPANRILAMYDAVNAREIRSPMRIAARPPRVEQWHGTMTSTVAAGNGYRSGGYYRGIASDSELVLVRAMTPNGHIRTPQVVRALGWISDNLERYRIRVVNLSLGVDETTDSLEHPVVELVEALVARGVIVVAASGNNPTAPLKPPGWSPSAITVGGYNDNNSVEWKRRELWHYSYGRVNGHRKPELLAPSIWVAAPILPGTAVAREAEALFRLVQAGDRELRALLPDLAAETGIESQLKIVRTPAAARAVILNRIRDEKLITTAYKHVDGTSFAAPIVSSVVAQLLEARGDLTPLQIKQVLCASAEPITDAPIETQGYGLVRPDRAVRLLLGE